MSSAVSSVLGPIASIGGLATSLFSGDSKPTGYNQYSDLASSLDTQSGQLRSAVNTGVLPPGIQGELNQAGDSAKASLKSMYASRGMSGSSSEVTDLGSVDMRIAGQGAQIAMQLLNTGIQEAGMAGGMYQNIMQQSLQQDQELSSALTGFASGLAGFGTGGSTGGGTAATGYNTPWGAVPGVDNVLGGGAASGGGLESALTSAGAFLGL